MRSRFVRRAAAAGLAAVACLPVATLAPAAASPPAAGGASAAPVGGPLLGSRGLVVRPLAGAPRLPADLTAHGWVLADLDTGQVLAARDPHGRFLPASTLKILTALTLIPRLDASERIRATDADVNVPGSKVGIVPGTTYSVATLFMAMLVVSANDAAQALARAAGGVGPTVAEMNAQARFLNADDTLARNPSGLDGAGEATSAYDLALISRAAMALPDFRRYVAVRLAYMPAPHGHRFQIYTHDRLLINYPGAIGIKNGYTVAAGGTFVGAARRGGHTLLVSLLKGSPLVWHDAAKLLTWGFAARTHLLPVGALVAPGSLTPAVPVRPLHARTYGARVLTALQTRRTDRLVLPLSIAGASLVAIVALLGRRRGRHSGGLRLPPI